MEISIADLRAVCDLLLSHLEATGRKSVTLDADYYWHVPEESAYDPYKTPQDLTLGQLSFDWRELKDMQAGAKEPLGYGLVWLASILRAIGEKNVP